MNSNPILDFGIDKRTLQYVGRDLQRPECILAERDGTLWSADARGGVVELTADGRQEIVTQKPSEHFQNAGFEAARYLNGEDWSSEPRPNRGVGTTGIVFDVRSSTAAPQPPLPRQAEIRVRDSAAAAAGSHQYQQQ